MELIKIIEREGRQLVSGRELHEFLEIRRIGSEEWLSMDLRKRLIL